MHLPVSVLKATRVSCAPMILTSVHHHLARTLVCAPSRQWVYFCVTAPSLPLLEPCATSTVTSVTLLLVRMVGSVSIIRSPFLATVQRTTLAHFVRQALTSVLHHRVAMGRRVRMVLPRLPARVLRDTLERSATEILMSVRRFRVTMGHNVPMELLPLRVHVRRALRVLFVMWTLTSVPRRRVKMVVCVNRRRKGPTRATAPLQATPMHSVLLPSMHVTLRLVKVMAHVSVHIQLTLALAQMSALASTVRRR